MCGFMYVYVCVRVRLSRMCVFLWVRVFCARVRVLLRVLRTYIYTYAYVYVYVRIYEVLLLGTLCGIVSVTQITSVKQITAVTQITKTNNSR
jgi:hypothetical protein